MQRLNDARSCYTKELLNLQEQLVSCKTRPDDFEFVSFNQLDLTETFEDSVKEAWNFHKKRLEDNFNEKLYKCQAKIQVEKTRNNKFQRLCDDGNQLIGIDEMTADFIIGKLMIIEENPYKIWRALESNFGSGYFNTVIE